MTTPEALSERGAVINAEIMDDVNVALLDSADSLAACFCCNPMENFLPDLLSVKGQAFDSIVVLSKTTGRVASSDFFIMFDHPVFPFPPHDASAASTLGNITGEINHCEALLEIVHDKLGKVYFTIEHDATQKKNRLQQSPSCECIERSTEFSSDQEENGNLPQQRQEQRTINAQEQRDQESLMLLAKMLKPGKNHIRYLFRNDKRVLGMAHAAIFLWSDQDRVVVCDVDGTITKSNVRGIVDSILTEKYDHVHHRVCRFLSSLKCGADQRQELAPEESSRINFVYLSSRPLFIADSTRRFLSCLRQPLEESEKVNLQKSNVILDSQENDTIIDPQLQHHQLPEGPLIGFGGKLSEVLHMELISHTVHLFKASQLHHQVVTPFCNVSLNPAEKHKSLFVAGFGNTLMDVQGYHMAGMSLEQIYLIDKSSRISCLDAETAVASPPKRRMWSSLSSKLSSGTSFQQDSMSASGSITSNLGDRTNNLLPLVNHAEPDEKGKDERPSLKEPLPRGLYKKFLGTTFAGYHDDSLHSHVFSSNAS